MPQVDRRRNDAAAQQLQEGHEHGRDGHAGHQLQHGEPDWRAPRHNAPGAIRDPQADERPGHERHRGGCRARAQEHHHRGPRQASVEERDGAPESDGTSREQRRRQRGGRRDLRGAARRGAAIEDRPDEEQDRQSDQRDHQCHHASPPRLPCAVEVFRMYRGLDERLPVGCAHDEGVGTGLVAGPFVAHAQGHRAERRRKDPVGGREPRGRRSGRQHVLGRHRSHAGPVLAGHGRNVYEPEAERRRRDEEVRRALGRDVRRASHPCPRRAAGAVNGDRELVRLHGGASRPAVEDVEERPLRVGPDAERAGRRRIAGHVGGHPGQHAGHACEIGLNTRLDSAGGRVRVRAEPPQLEAAARQTDGRRDQQPCRQQPTPGDAALAAGDQA